MHQASQGVGGPVGGVGKLDAIVEEARRRARKRRLMLALVAVAAALIAVAAVRLSGGEGTQAPPVQSSSAEQGCLAAIGLSSADASRVPAGVDPCAVNSVAEPNRIGTFSEELAQVCDKGTRDALGYPPDPTMCGMLAAQESGLVVVGEQLSNAELRDVQRRVVHDQARSVNAISAVPLLDTCLHKIGNDKPTLPPCEWALEHGEQIQRLTR